MIAQAGRVRAVTISTAMAGRGTDIILGGSPGPLAYDLLERTLLPALSNGAMPISQTAREWPCLPPPSCGRTPGQL